MADTSRTKVLLLCGVFAKENEEEIVNNATAPVEFSANLFQERLISGFKELESKKESESDFENIEFSVLSAPFIGAYPTGSKIKTFKNFKVPQNKYTYVPFNNIWGIRNFSRTKSLKKAIKTFAKSEADRKIIVVYCTHTPFIKAAEYAKKIDPKIKVCLYVPDLPQYMNLSANRGFIYNVAKKYDIASMTKHMKAVDSYVLLTEPMKEHLPTEGKPCFIAEGIFDTLTPPPAFKKVGNHKEKYIVYTGKLDEKFGAVALVDSMKHIKDENVRLVICGTGDAFDYALKASETDCRILPQGQVTPDVAAEWRSKASVLINPRPDSEEYTKYSFPSKNVEYLLSGKPTVAYLLSGMPKEYKNFIFEISSNDEKAPSLSIAEAINKALDESEEEISKKSLDYYNYAKSKLFAKEIALKIINVLK